MARLAILWTSTARKQRSDLFAYWNKRTGDTKYSQKIRQQVAFRLDQVSEYPNAGKQTDFPNIRVTALGHFSIFYSVRSNSIIVMSLWDNRNNPDEIRKLLES